MYTKSVPDLQANLAKQQVQKSKFRSKLPRFTCKHPLDLRPCLPPTAVSTKKNHYLQHSTHTPTRQATILQRRHLVLLLRQLSFFIFGLFLCPKLTLQCTVEGAGENTVNPDTADHPRDRHHKRSVRRDKRYFLLSCSSPTSALTSTCAYKVYSPFPRMRIIILLCVNQRWT